MALRDRLTGYTGEAKPKKPASLFDRLRAEKEPEILSPLLETPAPPSPEQLKTQEYESYVRPPTFPGVELPQPAGLPGGPFGGFITEDPVENYFTNLATGSLAAVSEAPKLAAKAVREARPEAAYETLQNLGLLYPIMDAVASTAYNFAVTFPAEMGGFIGGLASDVGEGLAGEGWDLESARKGFENVNNLVVHAPLSDEGKQLVNAVFGTLDAAATKLGEVATDKTGDPRAGATVYSIAQMLPYLILGRIFHRSKASGKPLMTKDVRAEIEGATQEIQTKLRKGGAGYRVPPKKLSPEAEAIANEIKTAMGVKLAEEPKIVYKSKVTPEGEPKPVQNYDFSEPYHRQKVNAIKANIESGKMPKVTVRIGDNGELIATDGLHTMQAYKELGLKPVYDKIAEPSPEAAPVRDTKSVLERILEEDPVTYETLASGKPRPVPVDDKPIVIEREGEIPAAEQIKVQKLRAFERKAPKELTPEEEAEARAAGEVARKEISPRQYQEAFPEKTVHEDWDKANSPRFVFEAAGDILREFQKEYKDPEYITEKLNRVNELIKGELNNTIHPDDSLAAARKYQPKKLDRLIEQYKNQPTETPAQLTAKNAIVALLENNVSKAEKLYSKISKNLTDWTEQIPEAERKIGKTKVEPLKPEKDLVTMDEVHKESESILKEAKDLNELGEKMQELTSRYENNLDKGFVDAFEENRYREWGDEMMEKINQARRQEGLIEEPPPEVDLYSGAPVTEMLKLSKEFKDWFGKSRIYKIVFHGSPSRFAALDPSKKYGGIGFHFGTREQAINRMGETVKQAVEFGRKPKGSFLEGYLKIEKPLIMEDPLGWDIEAFANAVKEQNLPLSSHTKKMINIYNKVYQDGRLHVYKANEVLEQLLKAEGYDGIIYDNKVEGIGKSYAIFDPEQFKSVKNVGTFGKDVPEFLSFGGTGEFQKMYERFVAGVRKSAEKKGQKLSPELNEILDKGEIVSRRKVQGRYRLPIYRAELEILKATRKLKETWLRRGFENPIRTFEEAGGEPFLDLTIHEYHAREHGAMLLQEALNASRKKLFKGTSAKTRRRVATYAIDKQKGGRAKLVKSGIREKDIPDKLVGREAELYDALRERFESWYRRLSNLRVAIGKEPFPKTDDYFTFIRNYAILENAGFRPLDMPTDVLNAQFTKMGATPFKFAIPRKGALYKLELDPVRILEIYEKSAARHIQLSPFIAKMRELQSGIKDPETGHKFRLVNENPILARSLHAWTNHIAGMRSPTFQLPPAVENIMMRVNSNLAASILGANARSAMIQVSALRNTVAEIGFTHSMGGTLGLLNPKTVRFHLRNSKVIKSRTFDVTVEDALREIKSGKIGAIKRVGAKASMKPLQLLDLVTALATRIGAYNFGRNKLHMSEARAAKYADDVVTKTQASAMPGDIAPIQRSVAGKFLTLFQTFTINDWDYLVKDVLGMRRGGPLTKAHLAKAMRYVAATVLFNSLFEDVLHIQTPFPSPIRAFKESLDNGDNIPSLAWNVAGELIEPIPIVGAARYGKGPTGPGGELIQESVKFVTQEPEARPWWELGGKWMGVSGTAQLGKSVRAKKRGESRYGQIVGTYTPPSAKLKTMQGLRDRLPGLRSLE